MLEYGKRRLNQNLKKKNTDISSINKDEKRDTNSIDSLKVRDENEKVSSYIPTIIQKRSSSFVGPESCLLDHLNKSHNINILGFSENCKSSLNELLDQEYLKSQLKMALDKL